MNTKAVGEVSEGIVMAALLKRGDSVSLPFGNNQRYDLIWDRNGELLRVQVKTGRLVNGCVAIPTHNANAFTGVKRDYRGDADVFLAYCPGNEQVYMVKVDECPVREVRLRLEAAKGGPTTTIRWAKDYELK